MWWDRGYGSEAMMASTLRSDRRMAHGVPIPQAPLNNVGQDKIISKNESYDFYTKDRFYIIGEPTRLPHAGHSRKRSPPRICHF